MHQGPILKRVKIYGKTTTTGHLFFIEKLISRWVGIKNVVYLSIFIDNHNEYSYPLVLPI